MPLQSNGLERRDTVTNRAALPADSSRVKNRRRHAQSKGDDIAITHAAAGNAARQLDFGTGSQQTEKIPRTQAGRGKEPEQEPEQEPEHEPEQEQERRARARAHWQTGTGDRNEAQTVRHVPSFFRTATENSQEHRQGTGHGQGQEHELEQKKQTTAQTRNTGQQAQEVHIMLVHSEACSISSV